MRPPTPIVSPWLHDGRILPAFAHTEPVGVPEFSRPIPVKAACNRVQRLFKDPAANNRISGRAMLGDPLPVSLPSVARPFKDPLADNRVRLRVFQCESLANVPALRNTGDFYKEGDLLKSTVETPISATQFLMADDQQTLGWWTNDPTATSPLTIPEDVFADYVLEWRTGANAGRFGTVQASVGRQFTLTDAAVNPIAAGDSFVLRRAARATVQGRVFSRPRTLGYWQEGLALTGQRGNYVVPKQLDFRMLSMEVGDRDQNVALYQPFSWTSFSTWNEVRNNYDAGNPPASQFRTIELNPLDFQHLFGKPFFMREVFKTAGQNGDGYYEWQGAFGQPYVTSESSFDPARAIVIGRNTVFNDSPQIPLPITYYIGGIYLSLFKFHRAHPPTPALTGILPYLKVVILVSARDGAGNTLFGQSDLYNTVRFNWAWDGSGSTLPPSFHLWLNWGNYYPMDVLAGAVYLCGTQSPLLLGQPVNPFASQSNLYDNNLVTVPTYQAECSGLGGQLKSSDGWGFPGYFPQYKMTVDLTQ